MKAPPVAAGEPRALEQTLGIWAPFGFRDFRLLWTGLIVGNIGTWMQFTATGYFVARMAPNAAIGAFYIGLLGASRAVPVLLLSPVAGVVADRFPRRRILLLTNSATVVIAFIFAAAIYTGNAPIAVLMVLSGLQAATQSFDAPARQSWVPLLVPRELVGTAIGMNSVAFNAPSVIGPPLAGLLIAWVGVASCMLLNSVLTIAVVIAVILMKPAPPSSRERTSVIASIVEGVRFLYGHPVLKWVVLLLVITALCVRPYNFLLPAYAVHDLHTDAVGLGWLMAASGVGAIGGAFMTAAIGARHRVFVWALSAAVMAAGVAALGLTTVMPVAAAILAVVGLATLSFIGSSNILLQTLSPDEMRGRALSVYSMVLLGLVPAGSLVIGTLATVFDLRAVLTAAGALSAVCAIWIYAAHASVRESTG